MTYEEAKAKARAAGIPEEDLTPEVIRQQGHTFTDPTGSFTPGAPRLSQEELRETLSMVEAEAKANSMPAHVLKLLGKVAGAVLLVLLLALPVLTSGCGSTKAAQHAVEEMQAANGQTINELIELNIMQAERLRDADLAKAEQLYADAVKSVTRKHKTTKQERILVRIQKPDGTTEERPELKTVDAEVDLVNPATLEALQRKRIEDIRTIEQNMQNVRDKIVLICRNRANAEALHDGLRKYFNQKADALEIANQSTDALLGYLDKFIGKKPAAPAVE